MIVVYSKSTGEIVSVVSAPDNQLDMYESDVSGALLVDGPVSDATHYVDNGSLSRIPPLPSRFHKWDVVSKSHVPDIDAAKSALLADVGVQLRTRIYTPVIHSGARFDADAVSRERITGMVSRLMRGDPLPAGWAGWRDYDNVQRWSELGAADVLEQLTALSRAIEDREQQLLVASWAHKAAIAGIESVDAALAYDVTQGWPQ